MVHEQDDGGSAFPSHGSMGEVEHRGMSLRAWLTGQALIGLIASMQSAERGETLDETRGGKRIAKAAVMFADATLAELAK